MGLSLGDSQTRCEFFILRPLFKVTSPSVCARAMFVCVRVRDSVSEWVCTRKRSIDNLLAFLRRD